MISKIPKKLLKLFKPYGTHIRNISEVQRKIQNSYYFMHGDVMLSSATVGQLVDKAADESGDRMSFVSAHQGVGKTYAEFRKEVLQLASGLVSLGLRKGDRIAIFSPNCYEWPVAQYATAKAGLISVTINPAYQAAELEYCLKKVGCKAIISADHLKTTDYYQMFCKMMPELPTKSPLAKIQSKKLPQLERIIMITDKAKEGTLSFTDVLQAGNAESNELLATTEKSLQFDDPINIQFTSGTTGNPKGALLTHHNIINNALICGRRVGFNLFRPTACCQVPLFHCFGGVFASLSSMIYQSTCVFPSKTFNARETLETIEKYRCTIVYGAPTMYMDMLHQYREFKPDLRSLKQAVIGGAASPEALVREIHKEFDLTHTLVAYGTTENSPAVAANGLNCSFEDCVQGILQPYEYLELKVVNAQNQVLPVLEQGELCVRGHSVFLGYWEDPEKTDEVMEKTNWYHTGDLATMNEYGRVKIVGRKKDMVIRGGENLFPVEIENFLHTHPAILEAQVVGVPDPRLGEELCAWICLKKGEKLTEEELRNFFKGKISHFKIPRYIMFVEDFPRTASGKIKKFEVKRISIEKLNL